MAHHKSVQDFYAHFVNHLQVDPVLKYLRDQKWLTLDEYETLKSPQMTRQQKAEKLLLLLPRNKLMFYYLKTRHYIS